ncbi:MAG: hypothetical protein ACAI44_35030 [Candidatus Sericytochromatia bacterium]
MGDLKLQGQTGINGHPTPVTHRKLKDGVSLEQIKQATVSNNLDEVVYADKQGHHYISYADELTVKNGELPKVGDKVNLPFLDEAATVVHVDDEWNEDLGFMPAKALMGLGGVLANLVADSGGAEGSDKAIQAISAPFGAPSKKEMSWASDLQNRSLAGYQPSADELKRFKDILGRYAADQQTRNQGVSYGPQTAKDEKLWVQSLEQRVSRDGYRPSREELDLYQDIVQRQRATPQSG